MLRNTDFLAKKQGLIASSERGSVIIWILLAVALFAALNYAVSLSSRSGSATISKEQAALAATEILQYGEAIKRAVQTLQINGCSDTEISFENNVVAGYENPNAPSDNSCHVFHPDGGGMSWKNLEKNITDKDWFYGSNGVHNFYETEHHGTSEKDLTILLPNISPEVCNAINYKMNKLPTWESGGTHNGTIDSPFHYRPFTGIYSTGFNLNRTSAGSGYLPPLTGCFCDGADNTCPESQPRYFYSILIVR